PREQALPLRRRDQDNSPKMTALAEWCASEGMPIAYHHHMAAPIETELDQLMKHSGEALSLLYDAGQYGVHLRCTPGEAARAVNRFLFRVRTVREEHMESDEAVKAPLLEAKGISKYFGAITALHGVNFHVDAGEVLGVVGDNGAGKSTLMKILSGLYTPSEGE